MFFIDLREGQRERNIDWPPPVHAPAGDLTCTLLVCGTKPPPAEPPARAKHKTFRTQSIDNYCSVTVGNL